jgi:hypothetical protein
MYFKVRTLCSPEENDKNHKEFPPRIAIFLVEMVIEKFIWNIE